MGMMSGTVECTGAIFARPLSLSVCCTFLAARNSFCVFCLGTLVPIGTNEARPELSPLAKLCWLLSDAYSICALLM
jgi:hypothetical protein